MNDTAGTRGRDRNSCFLSLLEQSGHAWAALQGNAASVHRSVPRVLQELQIAQG